MAQKTVAQLNDSVTGILQGLDLGTVTNLYTAYERAARDLIPTISIPTSVGKYNINLYDGITKYSCPSNLYGTNIIDLMKQGDNRNLEDYLYKKGRQDFDRTKNYLSNGSMVSFDTQSGSDLLLIKSTYPMPRIELDPMTSSTGWTNGGTAGSITVDQNIFYHNYSSLRFTLTGSGTGTLTKSISSVDLTSYVGVGVVFLAFRTPSATNLSSISVKIGSSASDYYSVSTTTGFLGSWTTGDWMIAALDLSQATTTGTPIVTAVDYAQISIAHTATLTNFYLGDMWIALPYPSTLVYETAAIFKDTNSNINPTITDNSDTIILNEAVFAIYEQECAKAVAKQQGAKDGVISNINEDLYGERGNPNKPGLYAIYRADNPAQKQPQVSNWYEQ